MKYEYIDNENKLFNYMKALKENETEIIALDIEGESNLHQYGEKLCLVQIYDGKDAVIIDPFVTPIDRTKKIFENRSIMKIMYDAPGDRAFLYKNCGIDTLSIFDLQAAVCLLDYEKRDLSSVLKQALQIEGTKSKKKYQKYNWVTRPLDSKAIEYAIEDVIYLFDLKDRLLSEIVEKGLLEKFILRNLQAQNKPHIYDKRPKLMRSRNFLELKNKEQGVFEKLFNTREEHAKKLNLPPNSVLLNDLLFKLTTSKVNLQKTNLGKNIPERTKDQIFEEMERILLNFPENSI